MKTRDFDILALSDRIDRYAGGRLNDPYGMNETQRRFESRRRYQSVLGDPISDILGGSLGILSTIFPNIFGGTRKALTSDYWLQILPGAGYWTTQLRNYLSSRIHYDVDYIKNALPFTKDFVYLNPQICGRSGWQPGMDTEFMTCYSKLLQMLADERNTGGTSPIGITPGGYGGGIDYQTLVPLGIGAFILVLLMKSKKKK